METCSYTETGETGFDNPELFVSSANFKRPIVILGPLNDIAMEKLAREMPDDYEVAGWFPLFLHSPDSFFFLLLLCKNSVIAPLIFLNNIRHGPSQWRRQ